MATRSQLRSVVSDAQTRGREAVARGREAVEAVSEVRDNMSDALDRSLYNAGHGGGIWIPVGSHVGPLAVWCGPYVHSIGYSRPEGANT